MLDQHVLLVSHPDASLRGLPVALGGLYHALELIDGHLLHARQVLGWYLELVAVQLEAGRRGPGSSISAVDGGVLAHVGERVLARGGVVLVLDLVDVSFRCLWRLMTVRKGL